MLLEFIESNRSELILRTRQKVQARSAPRPTADEVENGVPLFLTQFAALLAATGHPPSSASAMGASATRHGSDLLRRGFTIAQVVHDYGGICQAITELAGAQNKQFPIEEFHTFNLCLDNAIADAVTEYSRLREQKLARDELERAGFLAHELRNLISTATMAYEVLRMGTVAIGGSTGSVLGRSLAGLRDLIDRSMSEVRLASGQHQPALVVLAGFLEELEVAASLDANARHLSLEVVPAGPGVAVIADRQLLASAVSNLLQNAFKASPPGGQVSLRARVSGDRVLLEVEDACGGLAPGKAEELFRPFDRRGGDKSGLGLGLAIARRSVGANGGTIRIENKPGAGCVFVIELPLAPGA